MVELDSCCMHGPTRRAGSVGAVRNIKNVSMVGKAVMEHTGHVMLVGEGAERFAVAMGFPRENLLTEHSRKIWLLWKQFNSDRDWWGPGIADPHWHPPTPESKPVSYTHLDVYKRQALLHRPGCGVPILSHGPGTVLLLSAAPQRREANGLSVRNLRDLDLAGAAQLHPPAVLEFVRGTLGDDYCNDCSLRFFLASARSYPGAGPADGIPCRGRQCLNTSSC